jgi:hypothetical protein
MRRGSKASENERRLDCLETKETDFNALWASKDADHDGGQMNALALSNGLGVISGFYTKDGVLCQQFNEFLAPDGFLVRYKVEPILKTLQQEHVSAASGKVQIGTPYPQLRLPFEMRTAFQSGGKRKLYPESIPDMNLCPVLVRAALKVECPKGSKADAAGNIRCETAKSLSIRVRIEQIFEIAGTAAFKPIDTSLNPEQASNFNLKEVFQRTAK